MIMYTARSHMLYRLTEKLDSGISNIIINEQESRLEFDEDPIQVVPETTQHTHAKQENANLLSQLLFEEGEAETPSSSYPNSPVVPLSSVNVYSGLTTHKSLFSVVWMH